LVAAAPAARGEGGTPLTPPRIEALLKRMASTSGVEARYEESKELALLTVPLTSSGVIYFVPPDRFARFTLDPGFSSLVVDGEKLNFREGRNGEEMDLSGSPVARGFVESFMVLWSGDREALQRLYTLELRTPEGARDDWELRLVPRHAPLSRVIKTIVLRGGAKGTRAITLEEMDGDRTITAFDDIQADRRFHPAELERVFGQRQPLSLGIPASSSQEP